MGMNPVEKARELKQLKEVSGKKGLFVIENLSDNSTTSTFLDLRNGFSIYRYIDGEPENVEQHELDTEIRKLQKLKRAEGNTTLGEFG